MEIKMKRIFFLRHLCTKYNINGILSGRSNDIPIYDIKEIKAAQNMDITYCSTALRCKSTLDIFLRMHKSTKIIYTDRILERNLGILEGKSRKEMALCYPSLFIDGKFSVFATPPKGESFISFQDRVQKFYEQEICNKNGNILICSHNQFLKMLYFIIKNDTITEKDWQLCSFPHGEIIRIY